MIILLLIITYFIGTVCAYFAYRQYYPSLAAQCSQNPFPPRIKKPQDIFPSDIEATVGPDDVVYNSLGSSSRLN
jgi:diacylglycerol diphosphate phosphatase/phosphatidate phosphatase